MGLSRALLCCASFPRRWRPWLLGGSIHFALTQSHYITRITEKPEQFPVINGRTNHLKQILNNNCQQGHNTIKCTIHKSIHLADTQHPSDRYILFYVLFLPIFLVRSLAVCLLFNQKEWQGHSLTSSFNKRWKSSFSPKHRKRKKKKQRKCIDIWKNFTFVSINAENCDTTLVLTSGV